MVDLRALRAQAIEPGACVTPSNNLANLILVPTQDPFLDTEAIMGQRATFDVAGAILFAAILISISHSIRAALRDA